MQSFIAACAVAIVIAIGASFVLGSVQEQADVAYSSTTAVRL